MYRSASKRLRLLCPDIVEPLRERPVDLIFNVLLFRCYLNWHCSMKLLGASRLEDLFYPTFTPLLLCFSTFTPLFLHFS